MNKKKEVIKILKKFEQVDYKRGGVSLAPEMYNATAEHIVKLFAIPDVSIMLPIKAKHKLFGDVEILGIRTECSSNNNKMYMVKNDGEYFWVYDYETELISN